MVLHGEAHGCRGTALAASGQPRCHQAAAPAQLPCMCQPWSLGWLSLKMRGRTPGLAALYIWYRNAPMAWYVPVVSRVKEFTDLVATCTCVTTLGQVPVLACCTWCAVTLGTVTQGA